MKYVLVAAVLLSVYSFSQCYKYIAFGIEVSLVRSLYCRAGFFHFFPRPFTPFDFVIHLLVWIALCVFLFYLYRTYLKGRFF